MHNQIDVKGEKLILRLDNFFQQLSSVIYLEEGESLGVRIIACYCALYVI